MAKIRWEDGAVAVGRSLMGAIFLMAGLSKFRDAEGTKQYMASKGLPAVEVLRPLAAGAELFTAASLISGYRPRLGALAGLGFLVPTSFIFHDFWKLQGQERQMQAINFLKNVAIMGGLIGLARHGGGTYAVRSGTTLREELPRLKAA